MAGKNMGIASANEQKALDNVQEVRQFEDSKLGVKGLLDLGLTSLPPLFIHPPDVLSTLKSVGTKLKSIPTIDLSGLDSDRRPLVIEEVASAAREFGFFQVVNHGVPTEVIDRTIKTLKAFHEQPTEEKARIYRRESKTGVQFFSNVDLLHSKAASWRDTIRVTTGPKVADPEEIPEVCRNEVIEWDQWTHWLGGLLSGLLSEGLGLSASKLQDWTCLESRDVVGQYYPSCPQPDLTFGLTSHTDPGVITVLLKDQAGGLQVKHGDDWVDVKHTPGALIVNIGDLLQIMSNDVYKSVEHRVLANGSRESRLSVVVFFNPSDCESLFGPFPELVSSEKPAVYRQFKVGDYLRTFFTQNLDGKTLKNYYRA